MRNPNSNSRPKAFLTRLKIISRFIAITSLVAPGAMQAAAPSTEAVATLQEPFLIKLRQPLRRSLNLRAEIAAVKATAQGQNLVIDRWFPSEDALILRLRATVYLDRATKEAILRRLNGLPAVEFATTTSAAAGQIQPSLLTTPFISDSEIPEPRLRGFRNFDKVALERRIDPNAPHTKGILFVKTKEEALFGSAAATTRVTAAADHARVRGRVKEVLNDSESERSELIEFDEDQVPIMEMIRRYHALPWVEYAEPQYSMYLLDTGVNDPYANGSFGYHLDKIQARKAWDIKHDTNQIVAVIDTGLWVTVQNGAITGGHPDLIGNIFSDLSNTNFITSENGLNNPFDTSGAFGAVDTQDPVQVDYFSGGHGTHVAGIIGAMANNGIGSAGIAWSCRILPFRVFDQHERPRASFDSDVATAIDRAVVKAAKIINMSFGGPFAQKIADAIAGIPAAARGANAQTAMVIAAGNSGACATGLPNNDTNPVYPASLPYPNLIAVANTDESDALHCSSSYGPFTVDLAAPGTNIVSTLNAQSSAAGYPYNYLTGTSMSAPHVSGTLALIRETFPQSTTSEVLDRVRMGVDVLDSLDGDRQPGQLRDFKGSVSTGGRLNAYRALLPRSKMANVSCRAKAEAGDGIVINGFILRSNTTIVIRGIGPSLSAQGVVEPLSDPYLRLVNGQGIVIAENDNWKINPQTQQSQQAAIEATGIPPGNDLESAIVIDLPAGAYTAQLSGVGGGQGVALTEVYELSPIADPSAPADPDKDLRRTQNLSSRVTVRGGEQIAILGLIVTGREPDAATPAPARRVIFRAIGPSLMAQGVSNALADPKLQLFDSAGNMLAENDNWRTADTSSTGIYQQKIKAVGFEPISDQESIIVATLPPGSYTITCQGVGGAQGVALVEAYEY